MYLIKSPLLLKWFYPSLTWNKSRDHKVIYLTFDDGPIPDVTDFVLKTLRDYNAKATFFCIGDNIRKHPDIFDKVKNSGHTIGNHTFNHLRGWATPDETYLSNFQMCQQLTSTHLFRPPYGRIKKSQISKIRASFPKTEIIMWDVLSGDFDTSINPDTCYSNVIKYTKNGSVIVFHDSLKAFDRLSFALPRVLEYFAQKGFQFHSL